MNVNHVAFVTTSTLAIGTGICAFAAAATASTVATIAYAILATGLGGFTLASVGAWIDERSTTPSKYFEAIPSKAGVAIAGLYTFASQVVLQALIQGIANGIGKAVSRKIAGPDNTSEVTHKYA